MRTLSALALAASNAEVSDEVWLLRLTIEHANILDGPLRLVNDMANLIVAPSNSINQKLPGLWTPGGGATVEALGSSARATDADAAQFGLISNATGSLGTGNITGAMFIKKDRTPRTTRFVLFRHADGGGFYSDVALDTMDGTVVVSSTGGTHVAGGVIDAQHSWLVYSTRSGNASHTLSLFPAVGANATMSSGNYSVGTMGSAVVERPITFSGLIASLVTYIAFPFQIDLPGEDGEAPTSARLRIDNVDQQIIRAIRGLTSAPTVDIEVVLASQPETIEVGFYDLTIRSADYDSLYVEAQMTYEQIFTEPLSLEMTPSRFPGLF